MAEVTITTANFAAEVEQAPGTVLLDFWAPWCGYCRMIEPVLQQVDAAWEGAGKELIVGKINVDEELELAERFEVDTIPRLVVYRDGKQVNSAVGYKSRDAVEELLR